MLLANILLFQIHASSVHTMSLSFFIAASTYSPGCQWWVMSIYSFIILLTFILIYFLLYSNKYITTPLLTNYQKANKKQTFQKLLLSESTWIQVNEI